MSPIYGLSLVTLISAKKLGCGRFGLGDDIVDAKKPGPAQTSWAPNKATFMTIGGLELEKKLFKLSNFSEKDFIDKLSGPRVREAYAWPRKEVEGSSDLKPIRRKWTGEL